MSFDLESLPFLAGQNAIITRMADYHAFITGNAPNNWRQLLDASVRAMASAGREVALAKTEAESSAAGLRWKTYDDIAGDMHRTLLDVAKQRLQREPEFDPIMGLALGLLAVGRNGLGSGLRIIPREHWEVGDVDWKARTLNVEGFGRWHGVRILDLADLDGEKGAELMDEASGQSWQERPSTETTRETDRADDMPINESEFDAFMHSITDPLKPGDPGLVVDTLWAAAKARFGAGTTRQRVRDWRERNLPHAKRIQRGKKPRTAH